MVKKILNFLQVAIPIILIQLVGLQIRLPNVHVFTVKSHSITQNRLLKKMHLKRTKPCFSANYIGLNSYLLLTEKQFSGKFEFTVTTLYCQ